MPAPIDYGVKFQDPLQSFLGAYQTGNAIQQADLAQQQRQRELEQQKLITEGFNKLRQPGATAADYANLAMLLPETQAKSVREAFAMKSGEQQQNTLTQAGQVFAAFKSGKPEIAVDLMDRQIEAKRNSGDEQGAKFLETWRDVAKTNPKAAEDYFGFTMSQVPGGDKIIEGALKLTAERRAEEKAPFELTETQAKAKKAAVDAKFAESNAAIDLQKKGWDITKVQEDIKIARENSRIAALNANLSREGNALKRQELGLKLDEMKSKRDDAVRAKVADVESARGFMDNMMNTADRVLNTPIGVVESATGPISSRLITTSEDTADFEALVETLGSQAFLAQIPNIKGMGNLSNAEGEKLQASLQNLSLKQSPKRLIENVREAQRLILKARKNVADRYGVPESAPDTPEAMPSSGEIDALLKKYGAQ